MTVADLGGEGGGGVAPPFVIVNNMQGAVIAYLHVIFVVLTVNNIRLECNHVYSILWCKSKKKTTADPTHILIASSRKWIICSSLLLSIM